MDYEARRRHLLASVARSERELEHALEEVEGAVQQTFALTDRIAARPAAWLLSGFLVGMWFGLRRSYTI